MQTYLENFGSNFIVSALVPSLAFATLVLLIFQNNIPVAYTESLSLSITGPSELGNIPLLLLITIIIGFTLSSLNTFLYKLFEGYFLLQKIPALSKHQTQLATYYNKQLKRVERLIVLHSASSTHGDEPELIDEDEFYRDDPLTYALIKRLRAQRYRLASHLDRNYPSDITALLPTRFGNILRAAETYSLDRYGIDAVPMWPRLLHVIPSSYFAKIEQSNNQLAFLINCAVLSAVLTLLCIFALGNHMLANHTGGITSFAVWTAIAAIAFWLFYNASLTIVARHGDLIRGAYDLFRFDLLQSLRVSLPIDLQEEQDRWQGLSEFLVLGERFGSFTRAYTHPAHTTDVNSSASDNSRSKTETRE
ncbi:MAG: hypothetical protein ACT4QE_06540 [Anaerolineales bacterium]